MQGTIAENIPRRHTFEVSERISAEGEVVLSLDKLQARKTIQMLKERGFEAVAVCFLWSIVNPDHEIAIGRLIEQIMPGVPYTLSHKLIPVVREYRRASATAIDAALKPLMQQHLREMEQDLRAAGYRGEILVSTTVGGCDANFNLAVSCPSVATNSSRTILITCSPGERAVSTSCPTALA